MCVCVCVCVCENSLRAVELKVGFTLVLQASQTLLKIHKRTAVEIYMGADHAMVLFIYSLSRHPIILSSVCRDNKKKL